MQPGATTILGFRRIRDNPIPYENYPKEFAPIAPLSTSDATSYWNHHVESYPELVTHR